jgi:hypothetical protein
MESALAVRIHILLDATTHVTTPAQATSNPAAAAAAAAAGPLSISTLTHHAAHDHVDHQLHACASTHSAQEQAALALHTQQQPAAGNNRTASANAASQTHI